MTDLYNAEAGKVSALTKEVEKLKAAHAQAFATNEALIRRAVAAESARAESQRVAQASKAAFKALHGHHLACPGHTTTTTRTPAATTTTTDAAANSPPTTTTTTTTTGAAASDAMETDAAWDRGVQLEGELKTAQEQIDQLRKEKAALEKDLGDKVLDCTSRAAEVANLQRSKEQLARSVGTAKTKLRNQEKDAADIRNNLDRAHADLTAKEVELGRLRQQADDSTARLLLAQLQLDDAHRHYQQSQQRVEELESQKSAIETLEQNAATLQAEADSMQAALSDSERAVAVKDARIIHLEAAVQKALAGEARAVAEANVARDPVDEAPAFVVIPEGGASLEQELENASDVSSLDSLFEDRDAGEEDLAELEPSSAFSEILKGMAAPATAATQSVATQTSRTEQSEHSTQTETPAVSVQAEMVSSGTQTDTPPTVEQAKVVDSGTQTATPIAVEQAKLVEHSTQTENAPIIDGQEELVDHSTQTESPMAIEQAKFGEHSTQTDKAPIIELVEHSTQTNAPPSITRKKRGSFSFATAAAIFFALLAIFWYVEADAYRTTNNRFGVNRLYNSMGYQRRGRHLFGAIPVCYEHHESWLAEGLCQQFASGVQALEAYAGISYPPRW